MPQNWSQVVCVQLTFWASTKPPWICKWQGDQVNPWFGIDRNCPHGGFGVPSSKGVIGQVQDMLGSEVCTSKTYLGHDVNCVQG